MFKVVREFTKFSFDFSYSEVCIQKCIVINTNAQVVTSVYSSSFLGYLISLEWLNNNSEFVCKGNCPDHLISLVYSDYKNKTNKKAESQGALQ